MTSVLVSDSAARLSCVGFGRSLRAGLSAPISGRWRSLRFPLLSLSPSVASLPARSACTPGGPTVPYLRDAVPGLHRPVLAPALRAALAASRSASASGADRTWLVARPASPVRASPVTELRTAPCTCVRTTAGATADASGSVLRTTARGSRRTARRSNAAAAPLRASSRRCRFPHRSYCMNQRFLPAWAGFRFHTPRSGLLGGATWPLRPACSGTIGVALGPMTVGPSVCSRAYGTNPIEIARQTIRIVCSRHTPVASSAPVMYAMSIRPDEGSARPKSTAIAAPGAPVRPRYRLAGAAEHERHNPRRSGIRTGVRRKGR